MARSWSWQLLRAGTLRLDGGGMFGVVPKTIWSKLTPPDDHNRILLDTNCLLLDDGSTKTLIETGCGDKWSDKERGFYDIQRRTVVDALAEVGVAPQQINHLIVSHLHFDHAGGLTRWNDRGEAAPTFPNAPVYVQRTEWEDALANKSTMTRTYLRNHLEPIADRVKLIDGEREILPGISVSPVPGHTWGMQAIRFDDGQGIVCFAGDVIPTVHHVGLAFSIGYDMLPYQNMLTKKALLERAARENWRLALDHEPGHAVMRVQPSAERPGQFALERAEAYVGSLRS
jgi:glyoxylase-like metal-dependent hydrolase (beta-lactamase superfamily II)